MTALAMQPGGLSAGVTMHDDPVRPTVEVEGSGATWPALVPWPDLGPWSAGEPS